MSKASMNYKEALYEIERLNKLIDRLATRCLGYGTKLDIIKLHVDNKPLHEDYPSFGDFYEAYTEWVLELQELLEEK